MKKILIAEDEIRIASFLEKGLKANGFITEIAIDAKEVLKMALTNNFDLLLLDLGLPYQDGLDVLQQLRGQGLSIPIIILTARDDIEDKVAGLEGGADDYMTKPFRFEELLARIKLRLRLSQNSSYNREEEIKIESGDLVLDLRTRKVYFQNENIELSTKEFNLLETLVRHRGQIMSREQLLDRVWGYNYDPGSNIVDVYIGYLRKKISGDSIETVRGMGYRFQSTT